MGAQQSKSDYNYGSIVQKNQICEKRMIYDTQAKDVFLQQLKQIPVLQSLEELDKITFCGQPNELKAIFQYNKFTLHQYITEQEFSLKEVEIVNIIKSIILNMNSNKIQIHPKEILMPEYITLDPEIFLLRSDLQRIRQGNIKIQDYYLAPEILKGKCKSNIAAQIFSIGLISTFMMTKITPFNFGLYGKTSDEQGQTLQLSEQNLEAYISKINTGIYSQLLKNVIKDMLFIDPKLRVNEEQILSRLSEVQMFHSRKTLKLQDLSRNSSQLKIELNEEMKQSQISYNYLERPSDNKLTKVDGKLTIRTVCNSPKNNKENIEVEFITKKEKKQNYSFSACSSRSHIRGFSVKPLKKNVIQEKSESTKKRWK